MGKFCLAQDLPKKEGGGEKEFCFFFLLRPKKGRQALSAGNERHEVAEVRAQRLLGGWGDDSASLPDKSICSFG